MWRTGLFWVVAIGGVVLHGAVHSADPASEDPAKQSTPPGEQALVNQIAAKLTPRPRHITLDEGDFPIASAATVAIPGGADYDACRNVLVTALRQAGAAAEERRIDGPSFVIGEHFELAGLPPTALVEEAYELRVAPTGATGRATSPIGLLHAAQTLRQLLRIFSGRGQLPCMTIVDYPTFPLRGIYIEGGQERFGRIVAKDYLLAQIRRLSEFKMNTLIIECYNLFPYASFPACADEGTLSEADCREIVAESKRWHVKIIPSLQTLAQAHELVWSCPEGVPYREPSAPGLMCPSNPDIYPLIRGLYRDLLRRFDCAPVIGIGCSEIDMQWQGRYCPACRRRIDAGETVRDLLLGHAEKCIAAVNSVSTEIGRPVRPLMWADEFYMYGPGKDWVGVERIPRDVVMGYWKYWSDYGGIEGLLERGYDVLGISAMYNHTFYLADLSPGQPAKTWPPMEQTGTRNIAEMLSRAATASQSGLKGQFWGVATAAFSKHRLRAFDSIWYGFALNGHAAWGDPRLPLDAYQDEFTNAFARHFYDARTDEAADAVAQAYVQLDQCKSTLESANQTLGDVVGVVDTQEPGYLGNTLMGASSRCARLMDAGAEDLARVMKIRGAAREVLQQSEAVLARLDAARPGIMCDREWTDLRLAGEKIAAHAQRQVLLIDTQEVLLLARDQPDVNLRETLADLPQRWSVHRARTTRIFDQTKWLYSRGDPLGMQSLLGDIRNIESHLQSLLSSARPALPSRREVLLEEPFKGLNETTWRVLGTPQVIDGHLETRAPGGWDNYSGIVTRQAFKLDDVRPLVIEFQVTPVVLGVDSQLLASATENGTLSQHFSLYAPATRFGIYTYSSQKLSGHWEDPDPGWKPRAFSPSIELNAIYRVQAEITRRTWRVRVWPAGVHSLQPPLWDTGATPMDELEQTHIVFADVEPEQGTAASRWGPITIWRQP